MSDCFEVLSAINVNEHTEKKEINGRTLTYLSWPFAIAEVAKRYHDFSYEVVKQENGLPYVYDPHTGYMVYTRVTIDGITREMFLPVLDGANKAMKGEPYTYQTKRYNKIVEKTVAAADMFDINKTIMRCLVKNFAMFGLGLYIYAGEDFPDAEKVEVIIATPEEIKAMRKKIVAKYGKENAQACFQELTGKTTTEGMTQEEVQGVLRILGLSADNDGTSNS